MSFIFQLIVLFLCLLMFRVSIKWKLPIIILSLAIFNSVTISFIPYGSTFYIVLIFFFLSELKNLKKYRMILKGRLVYKLLFLQIIAMLIYYFSSPHYIGKIDQFIRLLISLLLGSYFMLAYSYCATQNKESVKCLSKAVYYSALIMAFIGIINLLFKEPIFLEMTSGYGSNDNASLPLDFTERFRVQSTYLNPFDYGYMCLILMSFSVYFYFKKYMSGNKFIIVILCCLFGVVTCNCRTIFICLLLGGCVFVLVAFKGRKKLKYIIMTIGLLIFAYSFIPLVQEKVDQSLTAFTDTQGEKVGGSNLDMRGMQFARVLYHIQGHELFGRGLDYFNIDMGWSQVNDVDKNGNSVSLVDPDLAGLEGIYLSYLLERGIVGLSIWIVFNVALIVYFMKRLNTNRIESSLGIVTVIMYILFANMTGELNSLVPTLLLLGFLMKIIDTTSKRLSTDNENVSKLNRL